jgi:hypothetical protein
MTLAHFAEALETLQVNTYHHNAKHLGSETVAFLTVRHIAETQVSTRVHQWTPSSHSLLHQINSNQHA